MSRRRRTGQARHRYADLAPVTETPVAGFYRIRLRLAWPAKADELAAQIEEKRGWLRARK